MKTLSDHTGTTITVRTYFVSLGGVVCDIIKASSHNAAEKKARKMFPTVAPYLVSVYYTEV